MHANDPTPEESTVAGATRPALAGGAAAGVRVAGFDILQLIGGGGVGWVFGAVQPRPRRTVALKLVRPGLMSASLLRRFALEVEVLGRLEHPCIARIYEVGTADVGYGTQPFFAMEFVR